MRLQCHACQLEFESPSAPPYARCPRCNSDQLGAPAGSWGAPAPAPTQPWQPPPGSPFAAPAPPGYGAPPGPYGQPQPIQPAAPLDVQGLQIGSVLVLLFCCQPAGIVGLIWIEEAKRLHGQGQLELATKKLDQVKMALIIGPALGLVAGILYFVLSVIGAIAGR